MWPWRRRSTPPAAPVARAEWRTLPPIARIVPEHPLVNPVQRFTDGLAAWRNPSLLAPLGHRVGAGEPSGSAEVVSSVVDGPRPAVVLRTVADQAPGARPPAAPAAFEPPAVPSGTGAPSPSPVPEPALDSPLWTELVGVGADRSEQEKQPFGGERSDPTPDPTTDRPELSTFVVGRSSGLDHSATTAGDAAAAEPDHPLAGDATMSPAGGTGPAPDPTRTPAGSTGTEASLPPVAQRAVATDQGSGQARRLGLGEPLPVPRPAAPTPMVAHARPTIGDPLAVSGEPPPAPARRSTPEPAPTPEPVSVSHEPSAALEPPGAPTSGPAVGDGSAVQRSTSGPGLPAGPLPTRPPEAVMPGLPGSGAEPVAPVAESSGPVPPGEPSSAGPFGIGDQGTTRSADAVGTAPLIGGVESSQTPADDAPAVQRSPSGADLPLAGRHPAPMTGASSTGHGIASQAGFVMPSAMPGDGAPALPRSASETELPLVFETSMASLQAEAHTVSVESSDGDVPAVQRSTSGLDLPRPEPVAGSPEVPTASPTEVGSESAPTIGGVGATPVAEPARPLVSAGDVAALQRSTPDTESRQAGHPLARSPMASPPGAGVESMAPTVGGVDPAASTALGRTLAAADGVPMVQRSAYASEPLSGGSSFVRSPMGSPLGAESVVPTVGGTDAVASMPPGRDLASADGVPSLQRSASVREPLSSVRRFVESPMASALDAGSVAPTVGGVIPSTRPDRVSSVADGLPEVRRASSTIDSPLIGHSPARSPMAGMFGSRPVVPTAGVGAVPVSRAVEWSVSGGEAPTLQRLASPLIGSFEAPLGLPLAPVQRSAVEQVSPRSPQTPVQSVGPVTFAQRVESAEPPTRPSEPVTDTPAPPAGTPAGHAPAGHAPAEQVPEELVRKLFDPLLRRLKVELRLERERRGRVTDRWR